MFTRVSVIPIEKCFKSFLCKLGRYIFRALVNAMLLLLFIHIILCFFCSVYNVMEIKRLTRFNDTNILSWKAFFQFQVIS